MIKSKARQNVEIVSGILTRVAEHLEAPSSSWQEEILKDIEEAGEIIEKIRKGISPQN